MLTALVAAVPVTITAVAGLLVSLQNGRKADVAAVKQQEIHVLVNSNLTKVKADLETAKTEIAALHGLLRDFAAERPPPAA